jgi:hypothetical protein
MRRKTVTKFIKWEVAVGKINLTNLEFNAITPIWGVHLMGQFAGGSSANLLIRRKTIPIF